MFKNFIYKIVNDIFVSSFITLIVFVILEWLEPGFVSYYLSFNLLLIIPLISGIVTLLIQKK